MSEENVEVVRRYLEEAHVSSEHFAEHFAAAGTRFWEPDGDYYPIRGFPEARPCHGREEIVRFFIGWRSVWEDYGMHVKDAWAIADDRVLAHVHIRGTGRTSGVALGGDAYLCFWLRHGRFIRAEDHLTEKGALHALGMSGETLEAARLRDG
jgi:SnoaL-like domain